jgi:hypothetical protein
MAFVENAYSLLVEHEGYPRYISTGLNRLSGFMKKKRTDRKMSLWQTTVPRKCRLWIMVPAGVLAVGCMVVFLLASREEQTALPKNRVASSSTTKTEPELTTMEVATAVMVTVELDFGPKVPSIAEALKEIERLYQPDDGIGRTFAILDAYGEPTADGKLHMSMHVSSEKPGIGSLVFRRTGEVLWRSRIVSAAHPPSSAFAGKGLMIFLDNGRGKLLTLDGSNNPASILDANVKELGVPVKTIWPDGQEREVAFIYSACGCPVKVMVRRVGDRTVRTRELPVIFPDDPAAVATISRLMRW